jgi:long-chain acyl-CoA synthetase
LLGELHVLDEDMRPLPAGTPGTLWFKTASPFEYFKDPDKTKEARSPDGTMSTVGDVGYVDEDGYVHLTDRRTFMIISAGVNIYPQECENLLITHPKVADAAVFEARPTRTSAKRSRRWCSRCPVSAPMRILPKS